LLPRERLSFSTGRGGLGLSTNQHFVIARYALLAFFILSLLLVSSAAAQSTTGLPPFSTIHASLYDDVKINDGAILLNLPMWSKPGLIPFSYSLVLNNAIVPPPAPPGVWWANVPYQWTPQTSVNFTPSFYAGFQSVQSIKCKGGTTVKLSNFTIIDGLGTRYPIVGMQVDNLQCYPQVLSGCTTAYCASVNSNSTGAVVHDVAGDTIVPLTFTDPNSNQLSYSTVCTPSCPQSNGGTVAYTYTDPTGLVPMTETQTWTPEPPYSIQYLTKDVHSWTDANGNQQSFTITYSPYTIKTNFGCSGPADVGPGASYLATSIATPEGTYALSYEATPGYPGDVTGRISKISFPDGASIQYAYSGGGNGITCDGQSMVPVLTRTVTDALGNSRTWKYDTTQANNETVVTDPAGNDTVYLFYTVTTPALKRSFYETQRQIYQGSYTSGTLLKTVLTCYNGNTSNCANPSTVSGAILQKDVYTTLTGMTQSSLSETKYDVLGNLTEDTEYDYNGTLISDRVLVYGTYSNGSRSSIGNYISNRVCSDTTSNGSGTILAQSYYTYDSHGNRTQTSTLVSGAGSGSGTYLTSSAAYNSNGTVQYSYDTNQNKTTYTYGDCNATMLTQVQEPMNLSRSMVWNCNGGVPTSSTDENSQPTQYKYVNTSGVADPFWRLTEADYPDGGKTTVTYNDTASPPNIVKSQLISSSLTMTTQTNFDGFGHPTQTALTSDSPTTTYSVRGYDPLERLGTSYNPTRCNPPTTPCGETTWGYTNYTYDALGRTTNITEPDGSQINTSYQGSCATVTDEAGNARESCTDALGRITGVWEDPGTSPHLNFETDYTYDALGNLLTVIQKGGATSGSWRSRSFQYDGLSRLTQAINPESGTISYSYTQTGGALCSGDPKDVCVKTAASPNQAPTGNQVTTKYVYDQLNRLTNKSYSDSYAQNPLTPSVTYGYDGKALTGCVTLPPSLSDPYPAGRLTAMCDGSGASSWAHDQMGRVKQEARTIGAATGNINYTYYLDGSLWTLQTPPLKTVTYTPNGAGRSVSVVDSGDNINFAQNAVYAPPGELAGATLGSASNFTGFTVNNAYNDRLQPILLSATNSQTSATVFSECFDFHLGVAVTQPSPCSFSKSTLGDNGNVYQIVNNRDNTRSQSFAYDALNRIASGQSSGTQWGETFTIDAWGNLTNETQISGKTYHEGLNTSAGTNNQLAGFGYDLAGNMTSNGSTSYVYDSEDRLVWTNGLPGQTPNRYIYDGDGQRVEKCQAASATTACPTSGTTGTLYFRGTGSDTLDETDLGGNTQEEYIFFNGQRIARRDVSSTGATIGLHYYFSDHLGTHAVVETVATNGGTNCDQDIDYYPYGSQENDYCPNVAQHYKFTGKERDSESGLDMFGARYYGSSLGRFMRPDEPFADQDPSDPQSWNLYAYVRNNPLRYVDPTGLWCVWEDGTHDPRESEGGAGQQECTDQGGHWDEYNTITGIYQQNGVVTQINTVFDSVNGGPCTSANCGAGQTLEEFDQTLSTYTRGDVPSPDVPINGFGMGQEVFLQVGRLTNPFTKQVNCIAAAAYPFIPGPKPEDVQDLAGLGTEAGGEAAESAANATESAAQQIKNAGRIGPSRAARIAKLEGRAKGLNAAGKALSVVGYALATKEAVNNFRNCEAQK
jgi:RHS repeat-associated protein